MERQAHGNRYEDQVIQRITGVSKAHYETLVPGGYTSIHDLVEGILTDRNISVKTTCNNTIDCGDALRRYDHNDYDMIVGVYDKSGIHTEHTFRITPDMHHLLWGDITREELAEFVLFVKTIPHGKAAQQATKQERETWKKALEAKGGLFRLHAKVDSKKQRRVQCSLKITQLLSVC